MCIRDSPTPLGAFGALIRLAPSALGTALFSTPNRKMLATALYICSLAVYTRAWLRAKGTEISAALWALWIGKDFTSTATLERQKSGTSSMWPQHYLGVPLICSILNWSTHKFGLQYVKRFKTMPKFFLRLWRFINHLLTCLLTCMERCNLVLRTTAYSLTHSSSAATVQIVHTAMVQGKRTENF